jgi:cytochrome c peroxidase
MAGCAEEKQPLPAPADAGARPVAPLARQAIDSASRAVAAATRFQTSSKRADYLALRRAVAAVAPYARMTARMGVEALLGPPRSSDEGGGALALLDGAIAAEDDAVTAKQLELCLRALRLIEDELARNTLAPDAGARSLSSSAYDLGLMLVEAYPGVPDGPDAVLADLEGALDGIESGARAAAEGRTGADEALSALLGESAKLRATLDLAKDSHALRRRAELVIASGDLGLAARRLAKALGAEPKLPYRARYPTADNDPLRERVTALTIPAPRRDPRAGDQTAIAALGRALFFERRLSTGSQRACSDCHQPAKAFSDGRVTPTSFDPKQPLLRNTPSLLYAPLHAAQLWDGQVAGAERQALKVIHTTAEMGLDAEQLVVVVESVADHNARFSQLFDDGVTAANVARALVAYEIDALVPAKAPIDRFARGEAGALDDEQHLGFDVFTGVARCGRCHVPPLFGGSRPTDFATPVYAALGVPVAPNKKELDPDRGRGKVTERALDEHAFKTPTARNVSRTAPFFHHGAFPTLEEVVDFYEKGGGAGIGIALDNQDPEVRKLTLTPAEKRALLAFMRIGLADP